MHLAAVFASNFSNLMFTEAEKIVEAAGVDFDVLKPLILETADKINMLKPVNAQTGPAKRGDKTIIDEHLKLLESSPETQEIYRVLSNRIEILNLMNKSKSK